MKSKKIDIKPERNIEPDEPKIKPEKPSDRPWFMRNN